MNFKPTLWKSIVSIFAIIIADIIIVFLTQTKTVCLADAPCPSPYFELTKIIPSIVIGLIVYSLWSLIQKDKKKKK